ncbi:MAG: hypothetical protein AAGD28_02170 [Bacteroidota bacterium]
MEWEEVDKLLKDQIEKRLNFKKGLQEINETLEQHKLPLISVDQEALENEFNSWLKELLEHEPLPAEIKSLYFGINHLSFPEIESGKMQTTIYLAGSPFLPHNNPDWAAASSFYPDRRYLILEAFANLGDRIRHEKLSPDYEVLCLNGMLNLLLMNLLESFKDTLLEYEVKSWGLFSKRKERESLFVGAGSDSGDIYLLMELKKPV